MKKTINIFFLTVVILALCVGGFLTLREDRATLFYENRAVEPYPDLSWAGLWSGTYFTQLDSFYSDCFVNRDDLIALDTRLDLALGRAAVHGVALGDGAIFPFHGFSTWDTGYLARDAKSMADRLVQVRDQAAAYGGRFYYVGVPEQYSYYQDKYPDYLDNRQWVLSEIRTQFSAALEERSIPFIDMAQRFDQLGRPDEFYSPTDHHYAYLGALETYGTLMDRINADTGWDLPVITHEDLELIKLPNPVLGSQNRKLYGLWSTDEALTIGCLKIPIPFTRIDNGMDANPSFYALPTDPQEQVTYSLYMGGDVAETVIQTDRPELPKCLIWGDSFTNALETVLWTSFDETRSLDLRYYTAKTLSEYIAEYHPDVIICLRDDISYLDLSGPNGDIS